MAVIGQAKSCDYNYHIPHWPCINLNPSPMEHLNRLPTATAKRGGGGVEGEKEAEGLEEEWSESWRGRGWEMERRRRGGGSWIRECVMTVVSLVVQRRTRRVISSKWGVMRRWDWKLVSTGRGSRNTVQAISCRTDSLRIYYEDTGDMVTKKMIWETWTL